MPGRQFSPNHYRFGFNGQEKDDEITGITGANTTATFWEYDARLGRRWNRDPIIKIGESPYACFSNNPIYYADPTGADKVTRDARRAAKAFAKVTGGEFKTGADKNGNKVFSVETKQTNWYNQKLNSHGSDVEAIGNEGSVYVFKPGQYDRLVSHMDKADIGGVTQHVTFKDWWDVDSWRDRMWLWNQHSRFSGITASAGVTAGHGPVASPVNFTMVMSGGTFGLYYSPGLGIGSEGLGASASVGIIKQVPNNSGNYNTLPATDFRADGVTINAAASAFKLVSAGVATSYNTSSPTSVTPNTYTTVGPQLGIGIPGSAGVVTGSVQKTYSVPIFELHIPSE